jgi:hypothetical protein
MTFEIVLRFFIFMLSPMISISRRIGRKDDDMNAEGTPSDL